MAFTLETLTFTTNHSLYIGIDVESFSGCRKHHFLERKSKKKKKNQQKTYNPQQHLENRYIALLGFTYSTSGQD